MLWKRRRPIVLWLASRPWSLKLGLGFAALGVILLGSGGGAYSWHYMQHDNGFCTGCHVMERPFGLFQARAGKHDRRGLPTSRHEPTSAPPARSAGCD